MILDNKNIAILGLGISGYWAAKLASSRGANVLVSDSKTNINDSVSYTHLTLPTIYSV